MISRFAKRWFLQMLMIAGIQPTGTNHGYIIDSNSTSYLQPSSGPGQCHEIFL
jgi:hypothetical protein